VITFALTTPGILPPAQIYPTADVLSAYDLVLEKFARAGTPVIIPTPAYMPFLTITAARGRDVIEVPMVQGPTGRWEMNLDGIARAFESGGHVLILCNPHNPLGRVYTRGELEALQTVVDSHDGMVFSDEIQPPSRFPATSMFPTLRCPKQLPHTPSPRRRPRNRGISQASNVPN